MKHYVILIPFHNPWDWHTDYANQAAIHLSRTHTVVCYLWADAVSLKEILIDKKPFSPITKTGNIYTYQPLYLLPGKRFMPVAAFNMLINVAVVSLMCIVLARKQSRERLFWFFGIYDPVFLIVAAAYAHWKTVYDCVDYPDHPERKVRILVQHATRSVLRRAFLVTANSKTLHTYLSRYRRDVHLVPLGFRMESFKNPRKSTRIPVRKLPLITYIGSIDYRLNLPLVETLVSRHPRWQFAILGPVFYDHLSDTDIRRLRSVLAKQNVIHRNLRHDEIPSVLHLSSAAIIPYDIRHAFTRHAFPMKVMEYLHAGLPTVSSPITELARLAPFVSIAHTYKEWDRLLRHAVATPKSLAVTRKAQRITAQHTWLKKYAMVEHLMKMRDNQGNRESV